MKKYNRNQEKDHLSNELKGLIDYQYYLMHDKMECYANFLDALQFFCSKAESLEEKEKALAAASNWYEEYIGLVYCEKQSAECLDVGLY
ncbi:MAG: hypothetical protein ACOYMB_05290 [Patescibacteria group bacterium]